MPCDMGMTGSAVAMHNAFEAREAAAKLERRIAELEQAMCGLCQQLESQHRLNGFPQPMHSQLQVWFDKHKQRPGCTAG